LELEKEIRFFDSRAGAYDVLTERAYRRLVSMLRDAVPGLCDGTAVDLGCGTGAFTRKLGALGLHVTGVDISPRSIARAIEQGGGRFVVGDIRATGLPDASFDCAVMSGVLHHVTGRDTRIASLREAHRLLKPGGLFFSYDPNAQSPSMWLYRDPRSPLYSAVGKTDNEVLLTPRQVREELAAAGFSSARVRGLSGIEYRYVEGWLARRLLPFYNHVYEPLIRFSGLESYLGTFVVSVAFKR
jgi:SAM-dependent methyltransferase